MAPPSSEHQRISGELYFRIKDYIRRKGGSCEIFAAPFAVFPNEDDTNYVEPDLSIICDKSKIDNKGCHGAPDWIIEIVSLGSQKMDYLTKLLKYESSGVREYWIVDPVNGRIMVYHFELDDMKSYTLDDTVKAGIYEDLEIDFSTLYEN
jgi:Uma2 family endonuclease